MCIVQYSARLTMNNMAYSVEDSLALSPWRSSEMVCLAFITGQYSIDKFG
jgi:hypothetical protein